MTAPFRQVERDAGRASTQLVTEIAVAAFDLGDHGSRHRERVDHGVVDAKHWDSRSFCRSVNRDGSTGMPYVANLPNQTDVFLVMPIREWGDK